MYTAIGFVHSTPARDAQKHIIPDTLIIEREICVFEDVPTKGLRGTLERRLAFTVPVGFKTDLASAPPWLWFMTGGKLGRHQRAAVCHDFGYRTEGIISKEDADELFYDIMIQDGTSKLRAWIMFKGVQRFGRWSYKGDVNLDGTPIQPDAIEDGEADP